MGGEIHLNNGYDDDELFSPLATCNSNFTLPMIYIRPKNFIFQLGSLIIQLKIKMVVKGVKLREEDDDEF